MIHKMQWEAAQVQSLQTDKSRDRLTNFAETSAVGEDELMKADEAR